MLETDGSLDILLLEIQFGEILELLIYLVNLYNAAVSIYYTRKMAELLIEKESLISYFIFIRRDFNLYYIN